MKNKISKIFLAFLVTISFVMPVNATIIDEKVMEQNYASQQDRNSANKHYRDIHALGKDGFAENMWNTIV